MKLNFLNWGKPNKKLPNRDVSDIQGICSVLFIDDKSFKIIETLRKNGWRNVNRIADVDSLDQIELKSAQILFVDINGVGKKLGFKDEGLGLIIALRDKYPDKFIIVYSAESNGLISAFHKAFNCVDYQIKKDEDYYQFQLIIEKFAVESYTLEACIRRINNTISKELGYYIPESQVTEILNQMVNGKKPIGIESIATKLGVSLNTAANIASIAQVFIQNG